MIKSALDGEPNLFMLIFFSFSYQFNQFFKHQYFQMRSLTQKICRATTYNLLFSIDTIIMIIINVLNTVPINFSDKYIHITTSEFMLMAISLAENFTMRK